MWNEKNNKIKRTIKSTQYEEGDRCALNMSWIDKSFEPLNVLNCTSSKRFGSPDRKVKYILE